jgi:uncharacterized membrane protein YhiD involved in acid resistance
MLDIFGNTFKTPVQVHWGELLTRLCTATVLGFVVMFVYRFSRKGVPRNHSFEVTLVLLCILIATVTNVIGDSVARAFSLVGALSIVRFRTVVRDTQDTAYVIFSVVVGMAVGASLFPIAIIGIVVVSIASFILKSRKTVLAWSNETDCTLTLKVPIGALLDELNASFLPRYLESFQLTSISTASKGMSLEASYNVRLRSNISPTDLVRELNKTEGVQGVELISPEAPVPK